MWERRTSPIWKHIHTFMYAANLFFHDNWWPPRETGNKLLFNALNWLMISFVYRLFGDMTFFFKSCFLRIVHPLWDDPAACRFLNGKKTSRLSFIIILFLMHTAPILFGLGVMQTIQEWKKEIELSHVFWVATQCASLNYVHPIFCI